MTCLILALALFAAAAIGAAQAPIPTMQPGKEAQPMSSPTPLMEPHALELLKRMIANLADTTAFAFHSRSMIEVPARTGQFVSLSAEAEAAVQRPNKMRATITGEIPNFDFYYDGTNIWAHAPHNKVYSVAPAADNLDAMLKSLEERTGIRFAAAEVMLSKPFAMLATNLTSAFSVGTAKVEGVPCDHLAFMRPGVNWEVWIESGEKALPRRLAITYTDVQNFPRFLLEFTTWNLQPKLAPESFAFKPPSDAKQIDFQASPPTPTGRPTK